VEKNLAWEAAQAVKQQQSNADAASDLLVALGGAPGVPAGLGSCRLQVRGETGSGAGQEPGQELDRPSLLTVAADLWSSRPTALSLLARPALPTNRSTTSIPPSRTST